MIQLSLPWLLMSLTLFFIHNTWLISSTCMCIHSTWKFHSTRKTYIYIIIFTAYFPSKDCMIQQCRNLDLFSDTTQPLKADISGIFFFDTKILAPIQTWPAGNHPSCRSSHSSTITTSSLFMFTFLFFSLKAKCKTLKLDTLKYRYNCKM